MSLGSMMDALKTAAGTCQELKVDFENLASLPRGLMGQERRDLIRKGWDFFSGLEREVHHWQELEPNIEYLMQKVLPWLRLPSGDSRTTAKVNGINHLALGSVDQAVKDVVDSIFVALQRLSAIKSPSLGSVKDAGWLILHDKYSIERIRALHVPDINEKLTALLVNLQHLNIPQRKCIRNRRADHHRATPRPR